MLTRIKLAIKANPIRHLYQRRADSYLYQRRTDSLEPTAANAHGVSGEDTKLVDRLIASYLRRAEMPTGQWADIYLDRHRDIHEALIAGNRERIREILRNPVCSDLMYGFDSMAKSHRRGSKSGNPHEPALTLDALISLSEAIGARRVDNPERYHGRPNRTTAGEILLELERAFGFEIPVPNFFPSEYGLISPRGIVSYRVPQAIWQAWRIAQLVGGISNPKILEIGGGLGRTAFYARKFGITDYTIIDIPVSSLAQGYFLGRALGDQVVRLHGETGDGQIKLMAPAYFLDGAERYDLIINIDSLTEIDRLEATRYWSAINARAQKFLSVNHEANEFTVADLIKESGHGSTRHPHWMRRGYVEEVVEFGG